MTEESKAEVAKSSFLSKAFWGVAKAPFKLAGFGLKLATTPITVPYKAAMALDYAISSSPIMDVLKGKGAAEEFKKGTETPRSLTILGFK